MYYLAECVTKHPYFLKCNGGLKYSPFFVDTHLNAFHSESKYGKGSLKIEHFKSILKKKKKKKQGMSSSLNTHMEMI